MIKSIILGASSVVFGEFAIDQIRKSAEEYVYVCIDPEQLPNATKDQLLRLIHNNMRSSAIFFMLGSAVFGLGAALLVTPLISCLKESDSNKKEKPSLSNVAGTILGVAACITRLYFALRPPQELLLKR